MEILSRGDYAPAEIFHTFLSPGLVCHQDWSGGGFAVIFRLLIEWFCFYGSSSELYQYNFAHRHQ